MCFFLPHLFVFFQYFFYIATKWYLEILITNHRYTGRQSFIDIEEYFKSGSEIMYYFIDLINSSRLLRFVMCYFYSLMYVLIFSILLHSWFYIIFSIFLKMICLYFETTIIWFFGKDTMYWTNKTNWFSLSQKYIFRWTSPENHEVNYSHFFLLFFFFTESIIGTFFVKIAQMYSKWNTI